MLEPLGVDADRARTTTPAYLGYDDDGRVQAGRRRSNGLELDSGQLAALIDAEVGVFEDWWPRGDILYPGAPACIARLAAR